MFDSLIKAVQDAVKPEAITSSAGDEYFSKSLVLPPKEPTVEPLCVHTLTAIAEYVQCDIDGIADGLAIHISSPSTVALIDAAEGRHNQRNCWVEADCNSVLGRGFQFGQWHDVETFIISLQAFFVPTENLSKLLQVVGNLESGEAITTQDDGVTQQAAVKTGVRRLSSIEVPNPIVLAPYRSFPEIEQPESSFVFRLQQSERGVKAALFESGGGQWKLDAIASIKAFLKERLPDTAILA